MEWAAERMERSTQPNELFDAHKDNVSERDQGIHQQSYPYALNTLYILLKCRRHWCIFVTSDRFDPDLAKLGRFVDYLQVINDGTKVEVTVSRACTNGVH
jgi:hypothetical protein